MKQQSTKADCTFLLHISITNKTRIILLLMRITSFHVYVLERWHMHGSMWCATRMTRDRKRIIVAHCVIALWRHYYYGLAKFYCRGHVEGHFSGFPSHKTYTCQYDITTACGIYQPSIHQYIIPYPTLWSDTGPARFFPVELYPSATCLASWASISSRSEEWNRHETIKHDADILLSRAWARLGSGPGAGWHIAMCFFKLGRVSATRPHSPHSYPDLPPLPPLLCGDV